MNHLKTWKNISFLFNKKNHQNSEFHFDWCEQRSQNQWLGSSEEFSISINWKWNCWLMALMNKTQCIFPYFIFIWWNYLSLLMKYQWQLFSNWNDAVWYFYLTQWWLFHKSIWFDGVLIDDGNSSNLQSLFSKHSEDIIK